MSNEVALMARGEERMNVPTAKVQEYLAQGWKEISRTVIAAEVKQPAVKAEMPKPEAVEVKPPAKGRKSASK